MEKRKYTPRKSQGGGMPAKPEDEKVKERSCKLTRAEFDLVKELYGSPAKAIRTLLPPKTEPKKETKTE